MSDKVGKQNVGFLMMRLIGSLFFSSGDDFILKLIGNTITDRIGSDNYCAANGVCEKITRLVYYVVQ